MPFGNCPELTPFHQVLFDTGIIFSICESLKRPLKEELDGDIYTDPFMGGTILRQGLEQLGTLATQTGEIIDTFLPEGYDPEGVRESSASYRKAWLDEFSKYCKQI